MAWAIDQHCGSPSAKVTLWAIANHAGPETWLTWAAQSYFIDETEQSADSVQRRIPELEALGLVKRMPLRYDGRKSTDLLILRPSQFWDAAADEIEALLPRGMSIDPKFLARHVAADCGSGESATVDDAQPPQTLPQPAENVAATVRSQEPDNKPGNLEREAGARAREAEPHIPDAALLEELRLKAPTDPYDNPEETEREWRGITREERRGSVARYDEWLEGARKLGRGKIAGLPAYLRDKRWTRLAPLPGSGQPGAPAINALEAFSRAWWWQFHAFAHEHAALLRRPSSAASQHLGARVSLALRHAIGWSVDPEKREQIEGYAEVLVQRHKDSAEAAEWRSYYRRRGIDMPLPDKAEWIFVPAEFPAEVDERESESANG